MFCYRSNKTINLDSKKVYELIISQSDKKGWKRIDFDMEGVFMVRSRGAGAFWSDEVARIYHNSAENITFISWAQMDSITQTQSFKNAPEWPFVENVLVNKFNEYIKSINTNK